MAAFTERLQSKIDNFIKKNKEKIDIGHLLTVFLSYLCRFSVLCLPFVCSVPLDTRRYNLRLFIGDG